MNSRRQTTCHELREQVMLRYEWDLWGRGLAQIAGIDEAGRGPLAGPVVASAVVFPPYFFIPDVNDSKQLSAVHRAALFDEIMTHAVAVGVGIVDHEIIDQVNILNATYLAMHRAIRRLPLVPDYLLVDGNRFLSAGIPFSTIVGGDGSSFSIAAASIIAKVTRDRMMLEYDKQFPGYGFAHHKGYATPEHRKAIKKLGLSNIHRRTFRVREAPA